MNPKTLIISILLTAAATSAGTYYLTANHSLSPGQPTSTETMAEGGSPTQIEAAQDEGKPITIVVKTEIEEKHHKPINTGHIRDLKQPSYGVLDSNGLPMNPKKP